MSVTVDIGLRRTFKTTHCMEWLNDRVTEGCVGIYVGFTLESNKVISELLDAHQKNTLFLATPRNIERILKMHEGPDIAVAFDEVDLYDNPFAMLKAIHKSIAHFYLAGTPESLDSVLMKTQYTINKYFTESEVALVRECDHYESCRVGIQMSRFHALCDTI